MADITDAQRLEALTALSHQMMIQYHERRNLEWRIHVLIWTLIAVSTYAYIKSDINANIYVFSIFIILLVIIHACWTYLMQVAQARDQHQSIIYRAAADAMISGQMLPSIYNPHKDKTKWELWKIYKQLKWAILIIFTTVMIGAAAICLLYSKDSNLIPTPSEPQPCIPPREKQLSSDKLKEIGDDLKEILRWQRSDDQCKVHISNEYQPQITLHDLCKRVN